MIGISELIEKIPRREVILEPLPRPKHDIDFELAILASFARETTQDCVWYARLLLSELAGLDVPVQILLTDNTQDCKYAEAFQQMQTVLQGAPNLHTSFLHEPKPGKVHGINAGLRQVNAAYALLVDGNKQPQPGALAGLYLAIKDANADLVSATVVPSHRVVINPQIGNAGAAYVVRTDGLRFFPEVLNEDAYLGRLTKLRRGKFILSAEHMVVDPKTELPLYQLAQRRARHNAGNTQLKKLSVSWGERLVDLKREVDTTVMNRRGGERVRAAYQAYRAALDQGRRRDAWLISRQVLRNALSEPLMRYYYRRYIMQLIANPALCTWSV